MKFYQPTQCDCGGTFPFQAYGTKDWPTTVCDKCGKGAGQINPLSVSVIAERLLYRSLRELEAGEYTLSIVIGTMAVESFLTKLFFKVRGMDCYAANFRWPTEEDEQAWEKEYKKTRGGFAGPADVVSGMTVGMSFDEFVQSNTSASAIFKSLETFAGATPKDYFQRELFNLRNRIAHWGFVDASLEQAKRCHKLAVSLVAILRAMDKEKYGKM
jgi:hypothetical protein